MPHRCTNCERTFADGSTEMLSGCPDCGGNRFQYLPHADAGVMGADSRSQTGPAQSSLTQQRPSDSANESVAGSSNESTTRSATERARETVRGLFGGGTTEQTTLVDAAERERVSLDGVRSGASAHSDSRAGHAAHTESNPSVSAELSNSQSRDLDEAADADGPEPAQSTLPKQGSENQTGAECPGVVEDSAQAAARSGVISRDELPPYPTRHSNAPAPDTETEAPERPNLQQLREELQSEFESIRIVDRGQYELNLMELYERRECIIELQENGRYIIQVPESLEAER